MIGWRGEPGISDEPQHVKQGKITKGQLELLGIPYHVIDANTDLSQVIVQVAGELATRSAPVALLVRKGTFAPYHSRRDHRSRSSLMREAAIHQILALCSGDELLVATTGKTSRELCEARIARGELPEDFLSVGGMGHVSSLAFGVALGKPGRRVICLDGDGSLLMHMGSMAVIGAKRPANLLHVLLNNEAHESVGGQPTAASDIEFRGLAKATGYRNFFSVSTAEELASAWPEACAQSGPTFLEIRISCGSRSNLGRPKLSPEQNKHGFIRTMTKHR
jgi:phosphonopyruvate decarboxylase